MKNTCADGKRCWHRGMVVLDHTWINKILTDSLCLTSLKRFYLSTVDLSRDVCSVWATHYSVITPLDWGSIDLASQTYQRMDSSEHLSLPSSCASFPLSGHRGRKRFTSRIAERYRILRSMTAGINLLSSISQKTESTHMINAYGRQKRRRRFSSMHYIYSTLVIRTQTEGNQLCRTSFMNYH